MQQLVQHAAHGPDIRALIISQRVRLLWGHVEWSADIGVRKLGLAEAHGDTGQSPSLTFSLFIKEDLRLDVDEE